MAIGQGPHAGHPQQIGAILERAPRIALNDDLLGQGGPHPGHIPQQRPGSAVQVDAHPIHAGFDRFVQSLFEQTLLHIVLVLPHPDGFGIDFHQLRQGILPTARDGNGAPDGDIQIGELLPRQIGSGIDRSARFADHHQPGFGLHAGDGLFDEGHQFAGGGAVADGRDLHPMGGKGRFQRFRGLSGPILGWQGENGAMLQHTARGVHHHPFRARAESWVQSQHHALPPRGLQEEAMQVFREERDGVLVGRFLEAEPQFQFDRGSDQPGVGIVQQLPPLFPQFLPGVPPPLFFQAGQDILPGR